MQPGRGPGHQIAEQSVTRGIGAAALLVVGGVHLGDLGVRATVPADRARSRPVEPINPPTKGTT